MKDIQILFEISIDLFCPWCILHIIFTYCINKPVAPLLDLSLVENTYKRYPLTKKETLEFVKWYNHASMCYGMLDVLLEKLNLLASDKLYIEIITM